MDDFRQYVLQKRRERHRAWLRRFIGKLPDLVTDFLAAMIAVAAVLGMSALLYLTLAVMFV